MELGSMKGSMDRVHRGGPWNWGPCFVNVLPTVIYNELQWPTMRYIIS